MSRKIRGRVIYRGCVEGEALVTKEPITFFGGVEPKTGVVIDRFHELFGETITDKILVFPHGKGSTVGSYVLYQLKFNGKAPKGMICFKADPIVAVGAIIAEIPTVDRPESFNFKSGQRIKLNADEGLIEVF